MDSDEQKETVAHKSTETNAMTKIFFQKIFTFFGPLGQKPLFLIFNESTDLSRSNLIEPQRIGLNLRAKLCFTSSGTARAAARLPTSEV